MCQGKGPVSQIRPNGTETTCGLAPWPMPGQVSRAVPDSVEDLLRRSDAKEQRCLSVKVLRDILSMNCYMALSNFQRLQGIEGRDYHGLQDTEDRVDPSQKTQTEQVEPQGRPETLGKEF